MKHNRGQCVLLFLKVPAKGQVKTRLAAEIGHDRAVELYRRFVEDLVAMLDVVDVPVVCCFDPSDAGERCADWLGRHRSYWPQGPGDLGQRMARAFRRAFQEGFASVLVIGSDSPDLPATFVQQALARLDTHQAVIGPSSDGGYYLIGFSEPSFLPEVFENIDWSTDRVWVQTMGILRPRNRNVFVLPQWHDVDTRSDLDELVRRNSATAFRHSRTFALVHECGLDIG